MKKEGLNSESISRKEEGENICSNQPKLEEKNLFAVCHHLYEKFVAKKEVKDVKKL